MRRYGRTRQEKDLHYLHTVVIVNHQQREAFKRRQKRKELGKISTFAGFLRDQELHLYSRLVHRERNPLLAPETLGWKIMSDAEAYERTRDVMEVNPFIDSIEYDNVHAFVFAKLLDPDEDVDDAQPLPGVA